MQVIFQSLLRRVPVDPNDWRTALSLWAWKLAIVVFAGLLALSFTPLLSPTHSTARLCFLVTFLVALLGIHFTTLDYASQRPGGRVRHRRTVW